MLSREVLHDIKRLAAWKVKIEKDRKAVEAAEKVVIDDEKEWSKEMDQLFLDLAKEAKHDTP